jgi:hypothetical protein
MATIQLNWYHSDTLASIFMFHIFFFYLLGFKPKAVRGQVIKAASRGFFGEAVEQDLHCIQLFLMSLK